MPNERHYGESGFLELVCALCRPEGRAEEMRRLPSEDVRRMRMRSGFEGFTRRLIESQEKKGFFGIQNQEKSKDRTRREAEEKQAQASSHQASHMVAHAPAAHSVVHVNHVAR